MTVRYDDLEKLASQVHDDAVAASKNVDSDTASAKLMEVRLRAIRTVAELREKAAGPKELEEFRREIEELHKQLERRRRAQPTFIRAEGADRTGPPPPRRLQ